MDAKVRALIKRHIGAELWAQGKARAKTLVKETHEVERRQSTIQWSWADLSLEIVPLTIKGGDHSLTAVLMGAFIEDYQVPWTRATMHSLRQTAAAWPKSKRKPTTTFAVHKILKSHPQRFSIIQAGMTTAEATILVGRKPKNPGTAHTASAIECANACKSWARALSNRIRSHDVSDDLKKAIGDAWTELSLIAIEIDLYDELIETVE